MKLTTLESFAGRMGIRTFIRERSSIPDYVTGLRFLGYDGSGVTRDPKGVLRLMQTSTRGSGMGFPFSGDYFLSPRKSELFIEEPTIYTVGRTVLDAEVVLLAKKIMEFNDSFINMYYVHRNQIKVLDRFNMLMNVQEQVANSLENPRIFRERKGRLTPNPNIDGTEYTVDMAWTCEQIGEGELPYFLKGDELVVSKPDEEQKVLAHRYSKDPRVVVGMKFTGDFRKPDNYETEFGFDDKRNLMKLFREIYPTIHEVTFPDNTRVRTD